MDVLKESESPSRSYHPKPDEGEKTPYSYVHSDVQDMPKLH